MFSQLMSAVSRLQPGDQMKMHFQRAKPTWLSGQIGQGSGAGQPMPPGAAPQPVPPPAGASLNSGMGSAPPAGPAPNTAMPAAPTASPDNTAQRQMLIQRMQQMGMSDSPDAQMAG